LDNIGILKNKKIIITNTCNDSHFWLGGIIHNTEPIFDTDLYYVYFSGEYDLYILYLKQHISVKIFESLVILNLFKYNKVHLVLDNWSIIQAIDTFIELNKNQYSNISYSILSVSSENFTLTNPYDLTKLNHFENLFLSNTPQINCEISTNWFSKYQNKIHIDPLYALFVFYFKLGFSYFQKGLVDSNKERLNKIFLYSKNYGEHTERFSYIEKILKTNRVIEKKFNSEDKFWFKINYNNFHVPFFQDYTRCNFNLINETCNIGTSINYEETAKKNQSFFISEKTVKGLLVPTPSYILLPYGIYLKLKEVGFYLLNDEFGEYNDIKNYDRFCEYFTKSSDTELQKLFNRVYKKSRDNKLILEKYIYSKKNKEFNLINNYLQ